MRIEYVFRVAGEVQALVRSTLLFSFDEDRHQEYRRLRKVDSTSQGREGLGASTTPAANVERKDIWNLLGTTDAPMNPLHSQGQVWISIGFETCSKPLLSGQHEKEGRWRWEDDASKEDEVTVKQHEAEKMGSNADEVAVANGVNGTEGIFRSRALIVNLRRPGIENLPRLENIMESWFVQAIFWLIMSGSHLRGKSYNLQASLRTILLFPLYDDIQVLGRDQLSVPFGDAYGASR